MLMTTDTRLTLRAAEGNREAFETVYRACFPLVHAFAVRHVVGRHAVETLTARILARTFATLDQYAGDVPFAAWLLGVAQQVEREERLPRRPARTRARLAFAHLNPR
jgi:DNA-directed RNA polymerase specialized sigma24 family protein